ncbi:MAG: hypothetical protein ABIG44_04160, partial [Planctomycetota bacterium]
EGYRFDGVVGRYVEIRARFKGTCPGADFVTPAICNLIVSHGIGDMNCDGAVDAYDIDGFTLAVAGYPDFVAYYERYPDCDPMLADCNNDGIVNSYDIDCFIELVANGC